MITIQELYESNTSKNLIELILRSDIPFKLGQDKQASFEDKVYIRERIRELINNSQFNILLRGITKSTTKAKLISKLNSNDSLYDGLFLVGEKAKNFLRKKEGIPHQIKMISSIGQDTAAWIFEMYSEIPVGPINLDYFKTKENKEIFVEKVKDNEELIDYYLFGLHTFNSDSLVNFVSTTLSPKVAYHNQEVDKLVIFLWIPSNFSFYVDASKLLSLKSMVEGKKLPTLLTSFDSLENETSLKGFILPHMIIGVHDLEINELIINPALLKARHNWLGQGLHINQTNFEAFIKQTKYKRFLILTDQLKEINN